MNFNKKHKVIFKIFFLVFFACTSTDKNLDHHQKLNNNTKDSNKTCCESSRIKYPNEGNRYISNNTLSLNSTIQLQKDDKMKMAYIPEGTFFMGSSDSFQALSRELPQHQVKVNAFYMDIHEVTNAQFSSFVEATNYKTIAEQEIDWEILKKQLPKNTPKPNEDVLQPGSMVFVESSDIYNLIDISQWWRWTKGANWRQPEGPGSNIIGKDQEPVIHICYFDALAYATWCEKRLPTEAEWEWAARGGLKDKIYPWGNESVDEGIPKCNYWTGIFPTKNTKKDGFKGVAPVMQYAPNGYGLYDMAGNVWEICEDWYDENYYSSINLSEIQYNPKGPEKWNYPLEPMDPKRVIRGGSFLCNDSYCSSYRVSARMPYSQETGMSHTGFRCVKDAIKINE